MSTATSPSRRASVPSRRRAEFQVALRLSNTGAIRIHRSAVENASEGATGIEVPEPETSASSLAPATSSERSDRRLASAYPLVFRLQIRSFGCS